MNRVILVGRLTKDPELKHTNNDIAVVQFTIAVNRTYQNKSGEKQADFINCVVWRQQAENFAKYMRKGSLIGLEGQIQTRTFDDPNGVRKYITEVICDNIHFLESKSSNNRDSFNGFNDVNQYDIPDYNQKSPQQSKDPFEDLKSDFDVSNDDLPF
jgi:single-strand DNA-binding protein